MNAPVGYVLAVGVAAIPTWSAVAPLRGPWVLGRLSFRLGLAINELPFVGLAWLLASTLLAAAQGDLASPAAWTVCGAAVLTSAGLAIVARRGLLAGKAVENALVEALGEVPARRAVSLSPVSCSGRSSSGGATYPSTLFVAGSSAGGHLASMAALTPCDPAFQPGFETADTSVSGAISLYGYHGGLDGEVDSPSSPVSYLRPDAPPFFVAHGTADSLVPVEDTRLFVDRLRSVSVNPVVYAELPGAQHSFDLFHSLRFEAVIDGIEAFTTWARSDPPDRAAAAT
ncbi:alpha/beta hydrolase [Actinomadura sp. NPDC000600]|uniref:alpha/beta hydrolase n=1 Tax=Actinomadura sp. NPDC000600 TaxID=3154262 RepID=UPI003394521B